MDFSNFERIQKKIDYESIIANGDLYTDMDFPPKKSSLYDPKNSKLTKEDTDLWDKIEWKRSSEILEKGDIKVFSGGVNPDDIHQGSLGNCYFLSALASVAEFSNRIEKIFLTKTHNQASCYVMRLCIMGEFCNVVVDDFFPYDSEKNNFVFSQAKGPELWVILLEKAWAKINGNYEHTITGVVQEAFRSLTGAPVIFYNHDYEEDIWSQILEADKNNFIICASAGKPELTKDDYKTLGLVSDHAYSVISAVEVKHPQEGKVRLLKLRNPWGHKEWLGDWSDNSDKWTQQLRNELNVETADDGTFYICYNDYLNYYRATTICKVHDNYLLSSVKCNHPKGKYSLVQFELASPTKMYFTLSQRNIRMIARQAEYEVSFAKIMIGKLTGDDKFPIEFIVGKCFQEENITIELENQLEAGTYIAFCEVEWWNDERVQDFVINTYAPTTIHLESISTDKYPNFIADILKSCARKNSERKPYTEKGDPDIFRCLSITDSNCEYGFLYYENNTKKDATLVEVCTFNKLENYELMSPFDGKQVKSEIAPGENQITVMKRTQRSSAYSCTYYSSILLSDDALLKDIENKGKKTQIKYQGEAYEIYFYSMAHGNGYIWLFENKTGSVTFDGTFNFELNNLKFADDNNPTDSQWNIRLEPGNSVTKKLHMVDPTQAWGYKYSYSFKCNEVIQDESELIKKVKQKGSKKQIVYKGDETSIYYYVHFISESYVWFFENQDEARTFKATFTFEMQNLKIQGEEDDVSTWDIALKPGESSLKKIVRIDPAQESKYKSSYSYSLIEEKKK